MTQANTFKMVTTVYNRGREFYVFYLEEGKNICGEDMHYWGIDSTLFGEDGKLTREVNGCEGHISRTASECVESIITTIELEYIRDSENCSMMEAIERYYTRNLA